MHVGATLQMHNHSAQITDSAVKKHVFDRGFCPEHPDIKIRKKNFFKSDTIIPCPECATNRALDRRKKETEINNFKKGSPTLGKMSSFDSDSVFRMNRLAAEVFKLVIIKPTV